MVTYHIKFLKNDPKILHNLTLLCFIELEIEIMLFYYTVVGNIEVMATN